MTLKILYAGTPEIAVHPLDTLVQSRGFRWLECSRVRTRR